MGIQAKATQAVSQLMSINMLMWLTMLTLFAGIIFMAMAVYLAIAIALPPAIAALLAGVSLLGVFILLAAGIALLVRQASKPSEQQSKSSSDDRALPDTTQDAEPAQDNWIRENSDLITAGALATGVALAVSPGLRQFILRSTGPAMTRKAMQVARDFADR